MGSSSLGVAPCMMTPSHPMASWPRTVAAHCSGVPVALGASSYGGGAVVSVLLIFAAVTMASFVALTVGATAAGYQMKGEWLEKNANTVTSAILIGVGVVAYLGF